MSAFATAAVLLPLLSALVPSVNAQDASPTASGVIATGTNGVTNPTVPALGSYNQTSDSRLITVNSYDDFCIFSPPEAGDTIGDTEEEQVAWCTKPRNNARVIPDGTISAVHFVKTPLYVQITGFGDLTKMNIMQGDEGGELDPHGATGLGNPVGGNVTNNRTGSDLFYEEWMNYVAYDSFCIRICTDANATYSAANMCQHTFDLMGCNWVMPGDYTEGTFTSCDGEAAFPPGVYPVGGEGSGTTSTFAQRYTGTWSDSTTTGTYTIGYTVTPQTPYMTPASSNCQTYSSISNGLTDLVAATASTTAGSSSTGAGASAASVTATASGSETSKAAAAASKATSAAASGASAGAASASSTSGTSAGFRSHASAGGFPLLGAALTVGAGLLGAGALFL